jgi:hypothetical protein
MLASALVAVVVLPVAMMIQAIAHALTVRFVVRLFRVYAGPTFWHNLTVTIGVHLILLTALLAQVAVWAGAFLLCGALPDYATAFYHSAVNFTTLGYGDIVMPAGWRHGPRLLACFLPLAGRGEGRPVANESARDAPRLGSESSVRQRPRSSRLMTQGSTIR